jgi:hypothetical protein
MGSTGIGQGLMEIAAALMAIALIALLLNRSQQASQLVTSGASAFGDLLKTVTLQNGSSMNFGGFGY